MIKDLLREVAPLLFILWRWCYEEDFDLYYFALFIIGYRRK